MSSENLALDLLVRGKCSQTEKISSEEAVTRTIKIFSTTAQKTPQLLLKAIRETIEVKIDGMTMVALAILTAKASDTFLQRNNTNATCIMLLSVYGPPKILEFVEFLKSKSFGRGFGSRPQKWVRTIMEGWSLDVLKKFSKRHPKELYSLIILVHPRYHGKRGIFIRNFLNGPDNKVDTRPIT